MDNDTGSNLNENAAKGANGPVSVAKLKEYGKKAYAPLLTVVHKYRDDFTPYLTALSRGLEGGAEKLQNKDSSPQEKYVAGFFQEAAQGLNQISEKLKAKEVTELVEYLDRFSHAKPGLVFGTSYIAGIFVGRIVRHMVSARRDEAGEMRESDQPPWNQSPTTDQAFH